MNLATVDEVPPHFVHIAQFTSTHSPMNSAIVEEVPPHFVHKCEHQGCLSPMNSATVNEVPPHLFIIVNIIAFATFHKFSYC